MALTTLLFIIFLCVSGYLAYVGNYVGAIILLIIAVVVGGGVYVR